MNGVKFIRTNGGLQRELTGEDHISGLLVYGETPQTPKLVLSIDELKEKGVTPALNPVLYYHASEFFRINQGAKLYLQAILTSDGEYSEAKTLQAFAKGDIRQMAVSDLTKSINLATQTAAKLNGIAQALASNNTPISFLLALKLSAVDMLNLPNLRQENFEKVSFVIGQDAGGLGAFIARTTASITCLGACLGALSKAKVHESIAWVERQNLVSTAYSDSTQVLGRELDLPGFADGSLLSDYSPEKLQLLHDKGYLFLQKHSGMVGTFFNDSFTASKADGDFAYLENNRTIDKAIRGINRVLLPQISGPAYIDPDTGKIAPNTLAALESLCDEVMDDMKQNGEISGYQVLIPPNQQVLRNSKLEVILKLIPVGVLRQIEVKIGLTLKK
jgi:Protein of unknown function (DUF2586)